MNRRKRTDIVSFLLVMGIILSLNILSSYVYFKFDWTEDNKYTLSEATEKIVDSIPQPVYIRVMLEGEFPAGFKRLQRSTKEFLRDLQKRNSLIEVSYENPSSGSKEEINERRKNLAEQGIVPVNFRMREGDQMTEKLIYPYAIVAYEDREVKVNLLEEQTPGQNEEVTLNNSISLLEYKFANAFQKVRTKTKPLIAFTQGHGEIHPERAADFRNELNRFYRFGSFDLDSATFIPPNVKLIIVAGPKNAFTEKEKFILDQYVMNGGSILWLVNKLDVALDSLQGKNQYIPGEWDPNLDDLFFKYGFRVNSDLVLDLQCSQIPLAVGHSGGQPQFELFSWFYHPVIQPNDQHPVSQNMGRVNLFFPSSIDSLQTEYPVHKEPILSSSRYSRRQFLPMRLNFKILRYEPEEDQFDKPHLPMGYIYEGKFASLYENRITQEMLQGMDELGLEFKTESPQKTRMAMISDPEIITNQQGATRNEFRPMGFNPYEKQMYDNKKLMVNLVEYLINGETVLAARTKEVKLRLLDKVKAKTEKQKWQFINIGVPIVFLVLFAIAFQWVRKRKYRS